MKQVYRLTIQLLIVIGVLSLLGIAGGETRRIPATIVRVVDGDTIVVRLGDQRQYKVRLIGIDAYESYPNRRAVKQARAEGVPVEIIIVRGREAKQDLRRDLWPGRDVYLEFDVERYDHYGRLLAYVYTRSGIMINHHLIRTGRARPYAVLPNTRYRHLLRR